ncbi:hypothetical protein Aperf_G00000033335 [Anoplocephala perfoliata]
MFKRRRRWTAVAETAISGQRDKHCKNLCLYSQCEPHQQVNITSDSMVAPDNQYSRQPSIRPWLPVCISPGFSRSTTLSSWRLSGGHLALWFCLILLQQPCVGSGSPLDSDTWTTNNASFSPVNIFLSNSPLLNTRQDRRHSSQLMSSKHVSGLLQSGQTVSRTARRNEGEALYSSSSSSSHSSPQDFSSLGSLAYSSHSKGVQTSSSSRQNAVAAVMKRMQKNAPFPWFHQPVPAEPPLIRTHGRTLSNLEKMRLPAPRKVQLFIDQINPFFRENISPSQIKFIVNQWHMFRQTLRRNRRIQLIRAAAEEEARLRKLKHRQVSKKVDLFAKVVLRREAQALQKAASFEEFKRILLRANTKTFNLSRTLNDSFLDVEDLPEVSGGVVYRSHDKTKKNDENENRNISKRSLDKREMNNSSDSVETSEEIETEDHSEEELHAAYGSHSEFLKNACKPKDKTLCTKSFFPNFRAVRSTLFLPPGIYVKRCDNPVWNSLYGTGSVVNSYQSMLNQASRMRSRAELKSLCEAADRIDSNSVTTLTAANLYNVDIGGSCTCLMPDDECLPTEVRLKTAAIVLFDTVKVTSTTEIVTLTEHVDCKCKRRCDNRICVPPLRLNRYTYDDCYCHCPEGDARCQALLEGREKFTDKEDCRDLGIYTFESPKVRPVPEVPVTGFTPV